MKRSPARILRAAGLLLLAGCTPPAPAYVPAPQTVPAPAPAADWNRRLQELAGGAAGQASAGAEAVIGPEDLLKVTVFEATELGGEVRVSGSGDITLSLLGSVHAAGLTPAELEKDVERRLRGTYLLDPHVSVEVREIQSRPVSVLGAVRSPGVFQLRGSRTLVEVLAMAGGLADDAGPSVVVMRAGAPDVEEVPFGRLLSGETPQNPVIRPGDVVSVKRMGMVYVVGEVRRPGAFPLNGKEPLTVLQAIALGQGLGPTAAGDRVMIIRTDDVGGRNTIRVPLGPVLAGRASEPPLQPNDIIYVPRSASHAVAYGFVDALVRMVTLRGVF